MESAENRYAHLLQPIRELTKNWDIDVASELNDYLEELDEMCITFDGGQTHLNFAEAALLIQGSAHIYSKKVELLHSLVYQTLEYINDRNKKRKQAASSQEDAAGGAASDHDADDEAAFTPLDLDGSEDSLKSDSGSTISVPPLPPESLIPPETHEKHKLPLISVKGEILCSHKDFRINLFVPGDEDLILLMLQSATSRFLLRPPLPPPADDVIRDADPLVEASVGGVSPAEDFLPGDDVMMEQDVEEQVDRQQAPADGRMIRERRQVEVDGQRRGAEPAAAVTVWTFHDPYAAVGEEKPFQSGRSYRVPEGLDDGGKRKRRRAGALQDFRSWFTGAFDPPEHKLKNGPTFADLNYVFMNTLRHRLRTQRTVNRRAGVAVSDDELRRTFLQPEEAAPRQRGEEPVDAFRHCDLLGGDDGGGSDNEHEALEFDGGAEFIIPADAPRDELSYEDLAKLRIEQLVVNSRGYTQETALSRRVKDWEDNIRPQLHLQEERPVFDIHEYGERIVGALSGVGQRRTFASIVHGVDDFEVCKYLLASLQLANDYTVEVDSAVGLDDSLDSMALTLLSTLRATDRFKTLTASH